MTLIAEMVSCSADDDQRLQAFKLFYHAAAPDQRRRLAEYVRAVAALRPADTCEAVRFDAAIGNTDSHSLGVTIWCSLTLDGPTVFASPQLLRAAIDAWEQGEEYAPVGL